MATQEDVMKTVILANLGYWSLVTLVFGYAVFEKDATGWWWVLAMVFVIIFASLTLQKSKT